MNRDEALNAQDYLLGREYYNVDSYEFHQKRIGYLTAAIAFDQSYCM